MKDQWKQGLQWGGVAWLAYVAGCSLTTAYHSAHYDLYLPHLLPAAAWLAALSLTWTPWSRAGVGVAVVVQIGAGVAEATHLHEDTLAWLPLVLPVLPLVILAPERPRLIAALALVGRWRDAGRMLAGWRWIVVAMGTFLLARSGERALHWWAYDVRGTLHFTPETILIAFLPQALFFGIAALPPRNRPAMA
jgi:hypothetical protein